jgi:hypothetical protein
MSATSPSFAIRPFPSACGTPKPPTFDAKLGSILLRKRWLSSAQLQTVLSQQHGCPSTSTKKIGELLLEQSLLSPEQLHQALQEQYWRRNGYWVI